MPQVAAARLVRQESPHGQVRQQARTFQGTYPQECSEPRKFIDDIEGNKVKACIRMLPMSDKAYTALSAHMEAQAKLLAVWRKASLDDGPSPDGQTLDSPVISNRDGARISPNAVRVVESLSDDERVAHLDERPAAEKGVGRAHQMHRFE